MPGGTRGLIVEATTADHSATSGETVNTVSAAGL